MERFLEEWRSAKALSVTQLLTMDLTLSAAVASWCRTCESAGQGCQDTGRRGPRAGLNSSSFYSSSTSRRALSSGPDAAVLHAPALAAGHEIESPSSGDDRPYRLIERAPIVQVGAAIDEQSSKEWS